MDDVDIQRLPVQSAKISLLEDKKAGHLIIELRMDLGEHEMRVGAGLGPQDALNFGHKIINWALTNGARPEYSA